MARWRSPDGRTRQLLFSRGTGGLLEYWDFTSGHDLRTTGTALVTPVPHCRHTARLSVLPDGAGAETVVSLATWDASPNPVWGADEDVHLAVHDVARGLLLDRPCRPVGERRELADLRAVRCADRMLVFVAVDGSVVRVLDAMTRRWATLWEPELVDVLPVDVAGGAGLLVVGTERSRIFAWQDVRAHFAKSGERPAPIRQAWWRSRLARRAGAQPSPVRAFTIPLGHPARHAALLPDGAAYAVAGHTELAVVGVHDGRLIQRIDLPARCLALGAGPDGELIVGTRNGVILFDRLVDRTSRISGLTS